MGEKVSGWDKGKEGSEMGVGHFLTTYDCPDYYTSFFQASAAGLKRSSNALTLQY